MKTNNRNGLTATEAVALAEMQLGKEKVTITPPNWKVAAFTIVGEEPLVVNQFPQEAIQIIEGIQKEGHTGKKGKMRQSKDFEKLYQSSRWISTEGWDGFPAAAFRSGMISACKAAGFFMSRAKLALICKADGYAPDGTPLVRITKGEPRHHRGVGRNGNGSVDLRARAMFDPGWEMVLRIKYDADQFTLQDVANLLLRAGSQVGIGNGRMDSRNSAGCGWGSYTLKGEDQ